MAPGREGLRERSKKEVSSANEQASQKKAKRPPLTAAERAKLYRERLKSRPDYQDIKKKHRLRNKQYRLTEKEKASEEEMAAKRKATNERVKKHRALKKLESNHQPAPSNLTSRLLTRNQREEKKKADRERKRAERARWSSQKWRRHREACKKRYHAKKAALLVCDETVTDDSGAGTGSYSLRTQQRAVKKVISQMPKDENLRKKVVQKLLRNFGKYHTDEQEKNAEKRRQEILEKDRKLKRKVALKLLNKSKAERKMSCFGISDRYFRRLRSREKPEVLRSKSKYSIKRHHEVQEFYLAPNIATQLSEKKKIKQGKPRYVLQEPLRTIYQEYKSNTEDPISFSLFQKLRPKTVKLAKSEALNQCLCETCENVVLLLSALNFNLTSELKIKSKYDFLKVSLCPSDVGFYALNCINGICNECGDKKLSDHFKDVQLDQPMEWKRWDSEDITKRKVIKQKKGTVGEGLLQLKEFLKSFPKHVFNAQWQAKEFASVRKFPPHDSCISVLDFAENYRCLLQDEAQSAHWSYGQATIHPFVNYYACRDCNKTVTDVITVISADLKHDTKAVEVFTDKVLEMLEGKGCIFSRHVQWSDGCASQYKCKDAFHFLSTFAKSKSVTVERNFFGSRHGKNACDGESAVIKSAATRAVKSRRVIIQSALDLFAFCKTHLRKPDYVDETCSHYRRDFAFVNNIDRTKEAPTLHPIKGTRLLHAVKAGKDGRLQTRSLSCFCHGCESEGSCFNPLYVDAWKDEQLRHKKMTHSEDANLLCLGHNADSGSPVEAVEDLYDHHEPSVLVQEIETGYAETNPQIAVHMTHGEVYEMLSCLTEDTDSERITQGIATPQEPSLSDNFSNNSDRQQLCDDGQNLRNMFDLFM